MRINKEYCFFICFGLHVSANRMQSDENLFSRAMLRCSLTSPKAKIQHEYPVLQIFSLPNIAPRKFVTPLNRHSALYLRAFLRIFHTRKKMKSGYNFLSHADAQNVRSSHVLPPPMPPPLHTFLLLFHAFSSLSYQGMPQRSIARQTRKGLESRKTSLQALLF